MLIGILIIQNYVQRLAYPTSSPNKQQNYTLTFGASTHKNSLKKKNEQWNDECLSLQNHTLNALERMKDNARVKEKKRRGENEK